MRAINLQSPLQGRHWLNLIQEDAQCGWRLKPNLDLPASYMGFSFNSNAFGLRGPCDEQAGRVVFGTSFAMGVAVNNGENWHEQCLGSKGWLNLGLAVGFTEWQYLVDRYHHGSKDYALLLYHPNFWTHCQMYERWRTSRLRLFEALRWRKDWWPCLQLTMKKFVRRQLNLRRGRALNVNHDGLIYDIDCRYAFLDCTKETQLINSNMLRMTSLLSGFRQVDVVRIRVKQELVRASSQNAELRDTLKNYEMLWNETKANLSILPQVRLFEPDIFKIEQYHAWDSHWNRVGNRVFADWVRQTLI